MKKTTKEWFEEAMNGVADDAQRAEVLKSLIQAEAETEQTRIREEQTTIRAQVTDPEYVANKSLSRAIVMGGLFLMCIAGSCATCEVSDNHKAVEVERIRAEHPAPQAPAPSASASQGAKP